MSGGLFGSTPKVKIPKAVEAPAAAAAPVAAPITEVASGSGEDASQSVDELRKKFRPSKGLGSTGTGLSL